MCWKSVFLKWSSHMIWCLVRFWNHPSLTVVRELHGFSHLCAFADVKLFRIAFLPFHLPCTLLKKKKKKTQPSTVSLSCQLLPQAFEEWITTLAPWVLQRCLHNQPQCNRTAASPSIWGFELLRVGAGLCSCCNHRAKHRARRSQSGGMGQQGTATPQ